MKTPAAELFQPQGHGAHGRKTTMCCFSSNGVLLSASVEKTKPEGSFSEAESN